MHILSGLGQEDIEEPGEDEGNEEEFAPPTLPDSLLGSKPPEIPSVVIFNNRSFQID
ncbi:hypothetical protein [Scytonema sp. PCC 10023]|uniref:hypothetical protein n=1 Tax=Scytonema sp. PCC 10023 TaxID=1680591 RepID=UPI0039C737AB